MKKSLIIILVLFILIICYFLFFYRSDYQICLRGYSTLDIRTMCDSVSGESRRVPSLSSCGLDARTLEKRGWVDCPVPK